MNTHATKATRQPNWCCTARAWKKRRSEPDLLSVDDKPAIGVEREVFDWFEPCRRQPGRCLLLAHDHRRIVFVRALVGPKVNDRNPPARFEIESERRKVARTVFDVMQGV